MSEGQPNPNDPPPVPPAEPDAGDCCGEGCIRCIYNVYDESLERYLALFAAWQARHPAQANARGQRVDQRQPRSPPPCSAPDDSDSE